MCSFMILLEHTDAISFANGEENTLRAWCSRTVAKSTRCLAIGTLIGLSFI